MKGEDEASTLLLPALLIHVLGKSTVDDDIENLFKGADSRYMSALT